MKSLLVAFLCALACLAAHSQGTVRFANLGPGVNAPVYLSDQVTKASGSQFQAELFGGTSIDSMTPLSTLAFGVGAIAGYIQFPTTVEIPGVFPWQTAWVQVKVWNTVSGATFDQALASGLPDSWWASSVFSVVTGGGFQGPPPAPLTGLGTSPVYLNSIPEPSTFALASLGAAVALLRSFRHSKPNQSRQPAPVARQADGPTLSVRRGCAQRSATRRLQHSYE
jgi:hypothetical protein